MTTSTCAPATESISLIRKARFWTGSSAVAPLAAAKSMVVVEVAPSPSPMRNSAWVVEKVSPAARYWVKSVSTSKSGLLSPSLRNEKVTSTSPVVWVKPAETSASVALTSCHDMVSTGALSP